MIPCWAAGLQPLASSCCLKALSFAHLAVPMNQPLLAFAGKGTSSIHDLISVENGSKINSSIILFSAAKNALYYK